MILFVSLVLSLRLAYDVPKDWKTVETSSSMRLAQWSYGAKSEVVIFYFGSGQGGSVEANLDRWYGQFQQPDGGSTRERAKVRSRRRATSQSRRSTSKVRTRPRCAPAPPSSTTSPATG